MGWFNRGWGIVVVAGTLSLAGACLDAEVGEELPPEPVLLEALDLNYEQISWDRDLGGDGWRNELPGQPGELCECNGDGCYANWIDTNVGCDVCVVVRCPSQEPQHVCVSC